MVPTDESTALHIRLDERQLSVLTFALYSSWLLAFIFEGQIIYSLAKHHAFNLDIMLFGAIAAQFMGLFLGGFLIKTRAAAKQFFLRACPVLIAATAVFFLPPSPLWYVAIVGASFLAGLCSTGWGFYYQSAAPASERPQMAADVLIYSNVLMILLNLVAIYLSPQIGLVFSIFMLGGAFLFAFWLPQDNTAGAGKEAQQVSANSGVKGLLVFLGIFIVVITINSGLMYQVINPAFAHLQWLTSWYWALPYVVAILIMKNLPQKIERTYILYVALAMIGFAFIAFAVLDRSAGSYLVCNTLMLGACGIFDLFWWSVLGEMLDYHQNPAKIFGIGLSANVLGVLLGGMLGNVIYSDGAQVINSTLLALAVVCVTLALLPPLHKHMASLLQDHAFLTVFVERTSEEQKSITRQAVQVANLSERESQVASLLLQKKTYKMIASELFISENTVKYYVKNIYSKFEVSSRSELIELVLQLDEAESK